MKAINNIKEKIQNKLDNIQPLSNKGAVWVVVGIHLLVLGSLCSASPKKPNPAPTPQEMDKTILDTPEGKFIGIPDPTPIPTPTPEPLKKEVLPNGKVATYPRPQEPPKPQEQPKPPEQPKPKPNTNSKYTQSYTIKKGDTINSIAKKYRLSTKRLIQINHITTPNNIKEGQVLKFL